MYRLGASIEELVEVLNCLRSMYKAGREVTRKEAVNYYLTKSINLFIYLSSPINFLIP